MLECRGDAGWRNACSEFFIVDACPWGRRAYGYERPELTVLYWLVEQHWPSFRERVEEVGALPEFVVRDFEEYLRCGILYAGKRQRIENVMRRSA
jgi:hypothetical protein